MDDISAEHIKHLGDVAQRLLLLILNHYTQKGRIPKSLKSGLIVPIHKGKGKPLDDPANYRGITLSPTIHKLLELLILPQIQTPLATNGIPDDLQCGFQKGKSCLLTAISLQLIIELNTQEKKPTYIALLDAQTAFDHVWHQGLFQKLNQAGLHHTITDLMKESYKDSDSQVLWEGEASDPISICQGVKQGSILSPFSTQST